MRKMTDAIAEAILALEELKEDTNLPKNMKQKIMQIITDLQTKGKSSLSISKIVNALEEISEDMNLQSYTRTQLFNIVSILEAV